MATPHWLETNLRRHLRYSLAREWEKPEPSTLFHGLGLAVRDRLVDRMLETQALERRTHPKKIHYMSIEYLIGRSLENNIRNLRIHEECEKALKPLGIRLSDLVDVEPDAALGNGGLGRLAACFLDSMATLRLPARAYGINYEYGLFRQAIIDGYQRERPDNWLLHGTPWTLERNDETLLLPVYGRIEHGTDRNGEYNPMWLDWKLLVSVPHDLPIVGYDGSSVMTLRLYAARSAFDIDLSIFNEGDYIRAVEDKVRSETVSKVLYPSDTVRSGQELRLIQEYFLVASALRDVVKDCMAAHGTVERLPDQAAIQLNDTHPSLAVAELMRILIDEHNLPWDAAWPITRRTIAYTNHTLLPEALETWPASLLETVLPRHLQIICEINHRFLQEVAGRWPDDHGRARRLSIFSEDGEKRVRMAHLAIVGSNSVNGVSALHSELIKSDLVPDFHALWPERFNNKTNGISPRRWLLVANTGLASLLTEAIGDRWITDLDALRELEPLAGDPTFQDRFLKIKQQNKETLAGIIDRTANVRVDPGSLFDIQAKRFHEYKRQLLNVLHVIHQYLGIVDRGERPSVPRTYVFAGKAAPSYWAAKQIIKLIHAVGRVIESDPRVEGAIRVAFVPDYRVTLAERIIPAADLSEQISTAGKEASGTGNMKFALNGALTMGTFDGANIEIHDEVGADNIYIFGLRAETIEDLRRRRAYDPRALYRAQPHLAAVLDSLAGDRFCPGEPGLFTWVFRKLVEEGDEYFHLADFSSYVEAQSRAGYDYLDRRLWARKAILNVARMGQFSSDRTVMQYASDIWGVGPVTDEPVVRKPEGPAAARPGSGRSARSPRTPRGS